MSIVTKPKVDAVIVGTGWTGSIMARELLDAGLGVVCLERGSARETADDPMAMHDELKFSVRKALMQDVSRETYTFRNDANQQALPIQRWGAFKPGDGVGGASMHWGGHTFRMTPEDFRVRSHYDERYGKSIFHDDSSVMDWDLDYAELEWDFDCFEKVCGGGGTIMSNRPDQGVVNRYLQSWDVHNLFVLGGSVFPQNPSAPPTGTIGALTYWSARAIRERYLKSPGPLVG